MDEIINEIIGSEYINQSKSFEYAQKCSKFLRNPEKENEARRIIINILDKWDKLDKST